MCIAILNVFLYQSTKVLTPRVKHDFFPEEVSSTFVQREFKGKSTKVTGLDPIPAWLLKDGVHEITRPIAHLINSSTSTCLIPSDWKRA